MCVCVCVCRLIICVELQTVETVQCSIANSEVYVWSFVYVEFEVLTFCRNNLFLNLLEL